MRNYHFLLAAVLVLAIAGSSQAAKKPRPKPKQVVGTQSKKVWTNDELRQVRARGVVSTVGQGPSRATAQVRARTNQTKPAFPVLESRLDDPQWYADKAGELRAALDEAVAALQQEQDALAQAKDRLTAPGVALDKPSIGVTPDAALALLQAHVDDIQSQLDDLSDLARQHNIDPGVLRG